MNRCWYCDDEYALANSTALDYKELYCSKTCELLEQQANGSPTGTMLVQAEAQPREVQTPQQQQKITVKKEEN